jgi:hypothetical protein
MTDHGHEAQKAAEAHLEALDECLFLEGQGDEPDWPESAGPYCGCQTCIVREALHAAWPHLRQAALEGAE